MKKLDLWCDETGSLINVNLVEKCVTLLCIEFDLSKKRRSMKWHG